MELELAYCFTCISLACKQIELDPRLRNWGQLQFQRPPDVMRPSCLAHKHEINNEQVKKNKTSIGIPACCTNRMHKQRTQTECTNKYKQGIQILAHLLNEDTIQTVTKVIVRQDTDDYKGNHKTQYKQLQR